MILPILKEVFLEDTEVFEFFLKMVINCAEFLDVKGTVTSEKKTIIIRDTIREELRKLKEKIKNV